MKHHKYDITPKKQPLFHIMCDPFLLHRLGQKWDTFGVNVGQGFDHSSCLVKYFPVTHTQFTNNYMYVNVKAQGEYTRKQLLVDIMAVPYLPQAHMC